MITTAFALLAAASAASASPAPAASANAGQAFGPLTAVYNTGRDTYCVRSGWVSASFATGRQVRVGDCKTAAEWRLRGVEFTPPLVANLQFAAR